MSSIEPDFRYFSGGLKKRGAYSQDQMTRISTITFWFLFLTPYFVDSTMGRRKRSNS